MTNFIAIVLETAASVRSSIIQAGITKVIDGIPQELKSWMVQLENYEYDGMNICIHGIIQKAPMTDLYFHINRPMLLMKMTMIYPSN